ncbi:hypothetical protein DOK67_0002994 [Enterococcus sp. DIV0212c]|uniref:class I SAM-dependent methyltransferase n=1 Tax=Enterococcus sp. DIV0212c TaxID=2230867 RepID=UPI001A9AC639|nr:class I SAM-dependent methyltransferase [Enterococcus sp. DIV0212c]MBO1354854.1 class I SAM-dependent methyltransferase [Enterococcus sp. DIV0212c]
MIIWIGLIVVVLLISLFPFLLKQSTMPTGLMGVLMMLLWNRVYLPLVKWATSRIKLNDNFTILDIGVGNGASSVYLFQQRNSLSITGIDISEDAIIQAKKKHPNKNIHFETMDIHSLTFASETFDLVTAFQTHFHWHDLDQALNEIHRVLKQNGTAVFACEKAKINYFLPKLKKSADFQEYLTTLGFLLTDEHETNQCIMYTFQKK